MRKTLCLVMSLFILLGSFSLAVSAGEATAVSSFPDVSVTDKNFEAIEAMKSKGYINGYEDGNFRPDNPVTRAEFVKVLVEQKGGVGNVPDGTVTGFYDVDKAVPHWAYKYIYSGVEKKYINGRGDGIFAPDDTITYEEALAILIRFAGKEDSAKFAVNSLTPLWPNAYILTGERLDMHINTGLSRGMIVSRRNMAQMIHNTLKTLSNNVNMGGGISVGGGGHDAPSSGTTYYNTTGVIVSTEGICIDVDPIAQANKITNNAFFLVRTNSGEYITFREPIQGNKEGRDDYKAYLGYKVNITYFENNFGHKEVSELTPASSMTITTVNAENFDRDKSNSGEYLGQIVYFDERARRKTITLPQNLDDLEVVYNGVPLNSVSPAYDYNFAGSGPYVTLADLMPQNGTVTYINRDPAGGIVDFVDIKAYDTIVAAASVSSSTGYAVTDMYNSSKKYILDESALLSALETHYGTNRTLSSADVDIKIDTVSQSGVKNEDQRYTVVSSKSALNVYASRDMTKIHVISASNVYAGSSAGVVVQNFIEADKNVNLGGTVYKVSDYIYDNFAANKYTDYDSISDMFPLGEKIKARVDSFGNIVYIDIVEPTYEYGYLVRVIECTEAETVEESAFSLRIITKNNVSKYSDAANQTFSAPANGKIKLNGVTYKFNGVSDGYDELDAKLKVNAAIINSTKPAEAVVHATYAQPIRFIADGSIIKDIITIRPKVAYDGTAFMCSENYKLYGYPVYNPATVFSVPDDRYDYAKYKVLSRTDIKSKTAYNAELYEDSKDGDPIYNCVVLYDEGLTARPSIKSNVAIIKDIENTFEMNDDNQFIYKITLHEPKGLTTASTPIYNILESELVTTNTAERVRIGDVIVYGTDTVAGKTYIRNLSHVYDLSDRSKTSFNVKYDSYGEPSDSATPTYQFMLGTVVSVDSSRASVLIDIGESEPLEIYEPNMFPNKCKPTYFYYDEDTSDKLAVGFGASDRFAEQYFEDIAQMGDKVFIHIYRSSSTSITYKFYIIPIDDLDRAYPAAQTDVTYSDITFEVEPQEAKVTLSGIGGETVEAVAVGGTVTFTNVKEGYYRYTVSAENYNSKSDYIIIRHGVPSYSFPESGAITLERHKGTVIVMVNVQGALVSLAGQTKTVGEEGLVTFSDVDVGTQNYSVECGGYVTQAGSITVVNGYNDALEITLVPQE